MRKAVIIVGEQLNKPHNQSHSSEHPRQDYEEIAQQLGAELCCNGDKQQPWHTLVQKLDKRIKLDMLAALKVMRRSQHYNCILSTSEKSGIPIATLMSLKRIDLPHVVIAHKLSSGNKTGLFKVWSLQKQFHQVITVCQAQADYAVHQLGLAPEKVHFIHDKVDHHFFQPQKLTTGNFVLAVGMEQRDYGALINALAETDIRVIILANSLWSTFYQQIYRAKNVIFLSHHISYEMLRELYAKARLVVVPLRNVDYAAGVNAVLEAMAMAKPVIVSRTRGIEDYIVDNENGRFTPPGDIAQLREQILTLWEQPGEQVRLGENARQAVEETMNLDIYVRKVVQIIESAASTPSPTLIRV